MTWGVSENGKYPHTGQLFLRKLMMNDWILGAAIHVAEPRRAHLTQSLGSHFDVVTANPP